MLPEMDWNLDMPVYYDDMILSSVLPIQSKPQEETLTTTIITYAPPSNGGDMCKADTKKVVEEEEEEEKLKCLTCGFKAKAIIGLRLHYFNRHQLRHTCQFCGEPFRKLRTLNSHIKEHHSEEEKLVCPHCDYGTHLLRNLKHHITIAHQQQPKFQSTNCSTNTSKKFESRSTKKHVSFYQCSLCSFGTKHCNTLKRHIKVVHENKKEFKCNYCAFKTVHIKSLRKHMICKHMYEEFYDCPFCQYIATRSEKLYWHVEYRHKIRPKFFSKSQKTNYQRSMSPISDQDSRFKLKNQTSNDKIVSDPDESINTNENSHSPKRNLANAKMKNRKVMPGVKSKCAGKSVNRQKLKEWLCTLPFLEFYNKQTVQGNLGSNKEVVPKLGVSTSNSFSSENVNIKGNSSHQIPLNEESESIIELNCPKCHFTSLNQKFFDEHKKVFHDNIHSYECPFCDFNTVYKKSIIQHVLENHSKNGVHQCSICLYSTPYMENILHHVQMHFTIKKHETKDVIPPSKSIKLFQPIECNLPAHPKKFIKEQLHCNTCSFSTSSLSGLKDHFQIHVQNNEVQCEKVKPIYKRKKAFSKGRNPLKCNSCDFEGQGRRDLKIHIKTTHEDLTEYSCPKCEFRTAYISSLKTHIMARHTQERPYICNMCPYTAVQLGNLKLHIKTKHKENQ